MTQKRIKQQLCMKLLWRNLVARSDVNRSLLDCATSPPTSQLFSEFLRILNKFQALKNNFFHKMLLSSSCGPIDWRLRLLTERLVVQAHPRARTAEPQNQTFLQKIRALNYQFQDPELRTLEFDKLGLSD